MEFKNVHKPYGPYERYFKRILDVFFASMFAVVFCWLYVILVFVIRIKLGKPVLFKQDRRGKNGEIFKLYKFRTMSNERDQNGNLLPDKERLTKFGKILRSTSLDELPEIFNIIKGEMSFIGPRPLVVQYWPYYTEREIHRHDVRPGLSGLAQVNGRNDLQWEERFAYDLQYVNKITFLGDIRIMFMTIKKVIQREEVIVRGTGRTIDFDVYREKKKEEEIK